MIPDKVNNLHEDWGHFVGIIITKLMDYFPDDPFVQQEYINRNGLVLKPLCGCSAVGVAFLSSVVNRRGVNWVDD